MERESCEGDVLVRPRSCSSSSTSDTGLCQEDAEDNGYYGFPMDLRKKSPRSPDCQSGEDECGEKEAETATRQCSNHRAALNHAWQRVFLNALPAPAMAGALKHAHRGPPKLTARLVDIGGQEAAPVISTKRGTELYATGKTYHNDKKNPCAYACRTKNGSVYCDAVLELRKEPSKQETPVQDSLISGTYATEKDPKAILIRFLESRALSTEKQQQQKPEHHQQQREDADRPGHLSPHKNPPPRTDKYPDKGVKRAASWPKPFEITSESLTERLKRVRCKCDSEIANDQNTNSSSARPARNEGSASAPPWDQRSSPLITKRRFLGRTTSPDRTAVQDEASCKKPRICVESISKPESRPCSPPCDQRAPEDTLLQQRRRLAPAELPPRTYAYETQMMRQLYEHELLKRYLKGMAASGALLSQLSTPSVLASAVAPCIERLEEHDELGPAPGNHIDSYNCGMRKRAPRALTGKHVKHGTGASPSTLLTLRHKIQERQRSRQLGLLEPGVRTLKGDRARKGFGKSSSNGKKPTLKK